MRDKVELGEIVYCDLIIVHKGNEYPIKEIVYKNNGELFYEKKHLDKFNIKDPVSIKYIKVKSRLGFENKAKGYTEVKASTEQRNKITGSYE